MADILNRLTNRDALQAGLDAQRHAGPTQIDIDPIALTTALQEDVFGQDAVCERVAREIKRQAARIKRTRPLSVLLFVGPPATGKTHFAKVLANAMPGEFGVSFVEMSQFSQPHKESALFGQSKGYAGSDSYGTLTRDLRAQPRRVVILDEFEKAHREVQEKFLSAWQDGFVTESSTGEKVSTIHAIFIATSNAAYEQIEQLLGQGSIDDAQALSEACKQVLKESFSGPVLSRIDLVVPFRRLEPIDLARLVAKTIERSVDEYGLTIADQGIDVEILIDLVRDAQQRDVDAREITRMVSRTLEDQIVSFRERYPDIEAIRFHKTKTGVVTVQEGHRATATNTGTPEI